MRPYLFKTWKDEEGEKKRKNGMKIVQMNVRSAVRSDQLPRSEAPR